MACGFDKGLLAARYDGELAEGERSDVERHVASCPECARDLAAMKDLSAALKPLAHATAPMSIAEGVIREIGTVRPARRSWLGWGLSAAAVALFAGGLFYAVDRRDATSPRESVAVSKPQARRPMPLMEESNQASREFRREEAPAPAAAAEPASEERKQESDDSDSRLSVKPSGPPVVLVLSADVPAARALLEAYLQERERTFTAGAPLLGRSRFLRTRYLQAELSDDEVKDLEKRLGDLKETTLARGSFEAEKKRVAAEATRLKEGAPADEESGFDSGRGKDRLRGAGIKAERRNVIFVFETPPPAK